MTLKDSLADREMLKFEEDPDLGHVVKTLSKIYGSFSGSFAPRGLSIGYKITRMTVDDSGPQKLPPTAYASRNTISARVLGTNTIYIVESDGSVAGTEDPPASGVFKKAGYPKNQGEEIATDITADAGVELYVMCAAGQTSEIVIWEIG